MNKPTNPNIVIPESFAANGVKADFDSNKILNGFDRIQPDVLAGDNLNKFIDDTYKGLNYGIKGVDYLEERWKSQVTNCLLEIPQRIKYDLTDGTLTVKAGTVVIVPYGTEDLTSQYPVGSTFLNDNFKVYDTQFADGKFFVWAEVKNDIVRVSSSSSAVAKRLLIVDITSSATGGYTEFTSGSSNSTSTSNNYIHYNTTSNLMTAKLSGTISTDVIALPIIEYASDTTYNVASISQVFNGIGYIGSTVWVDKGVKCVLPNGRNIDETLKNIEYTPSKILIYDLSKSFHVAQPVTFIIENDNTFGAVTSTDYLSGYSLPSTVSSQYYHLFYNIGENKHYRTSGSTTANWKEIPKCAFGNAYFDGTNLSSFNPKQPFRAVDYNDKSAISGWGMPSNKYIDLTLGANNSTYIAPANGWFVLNKEVKKSGEYVNLYVNNIVWAKINTALTTAHQTALSAPVKKGDSVMVQYTATGTTGAFRFVYAEGEL